VYKLRTLLATPAGTTFPQVGWCVVVGGNWPVFTPAELEQKLQ